MHLRSFRGSQNDGTNTSASHSGPTVYLEKGGSVGAPSSHTMSTIQRLLGDDNAPKVVLAINFDGEHWKDSEHLFTDWLKEMPLPTESIRIEAVFRGLSTVMILSMPVAIWDLLPENPRYSFINFVRSSTLLLPSNASLHAETVSDIDTRQSWLRGQLQSGIVGLGGHYTLLHLVHSILFIYLFATLIASLVDQIDVSRYATLFTENSPYVGHSAGNPDAITPLV